MKCTKCGTDKPKTEEYFQLRTDTGKFRRQCRDCRKKHIDAYNHADIERTRRRNRESYAKYREKNIKRTRQYKLDNSDWWREYMLNYTKKRKRESVEFRIKHNLRSRIRYALLGKNKSKSTMELLGCTIEEFKYHLESQFKDGMSWDNYGRYGWHIDHIRPCSSFDLTNPEQQKECFHYTNLQPLWAEENLKKGDRYDY